MVSYYQGFRNARTDEPATASTSGGKFLTSLTRVAKGEFGSAASFMQGERSRLWVDASATGRIHFRRHTLNVTTRESG
jgi:hypothetical protein